MSMMSPDERLSRVLDGQLVDRPPVICTGGMMNAAVVDVMKQTGHVLPGAHENAGLMAALAKDVARLTGFENYGVPFCMTVEAEVLGSEVDLGSLSCEPKICREAYADLASVVYRDLGSMERSRRVTTILDAAAYLKRGGGDFPVVGSITGPISTAASLVDPMQFLKALRKEPRNAHQLLSYIVEHLCIYAELLAESGVDAIAIGDPTATGEILGPVLFREFALRHINRLVAYIQELGLGVIVHICGNLGAVRHMVPDIRANAISVDALVNLRNLKEDYPDITTMGNVSTYLLEFGSPDQVAKTTERLVRDRVDIIAPACGLSTSTAAATIRAMTETVRSAVPPAGWHSRH